MANPQGSKYKSPVSLRDTAPHQPNPLLSSSMQGDRLSTSFRQSSRPPSQELSSPQRHSWLSPAGGGFSPSRNSTGEDGGGVGERRGVGWWAWWGEHSTFVEIFVSKKKIALQTWKEVCILEEEEEEGEEEETYQKRTRVKTNSLPFPRGSQTHLLHD